MVKKSENQKNNTIEINKRIIKAKSLKKIKNIRKKYHSKKRLETNIINRKKTTTKKTQNLAVRISHKSPSSVIGFDYLVNKYYLD